MSGREFIINTWGNGHWENEGTWRQEWVEDPLENPFSVPDGFWVQYVFSSNSFEDGSGQYYQAVGPTPQDILLERTAAGEQHLLVGREPFGALMSEKHYWEMEEGRRLLLARQIHKGELGRHPEVPKLTVVNRGDQHRRSRGRNKDGWVRLIELARMSGLPINAILTNYWPVIDYNVGQGRRIGTAAQIELMAAATPRLIAAGDVQPMWVPRYAIEHRLEMGYDWSDTWIRKGVAKTVLNLVQFGHDFASDSIPA